MRNRKLSQLRFKLKRKLRRQVQDKFGKTVNFLQNKKLAAAGLLLLLVISSTASFFYFKNLPIFKRQDLRAANESAAVEGAASDDGPGAGLQDLSRLNMLLLGYGGPGHQGPYLADAIQVVHFDFERGVLAFISIPRDLWVELPNGGQMKVNQVLTAGSDSSNIVAGGSKVFKQLAEQILGLEIDYFIGIDFVSFKRLIGGPLGGITVEVPETLSDKWYPIQGEELNPCGYSEAEITQLTNDYSGFELEKKFECRYEHVYFEAGPNQMEGGDALAYMRSRHGSAGGDFSRSERQRAVLLGIRDEIFSLRALENVPEYFELLTQHVVTDLDLEVVQYLAPALKTANEFEVRTVTLSTDNVLQAGTAHNGQFILTPRQGSGQWSEVRQFVQAGLE